MKIYAHREISQVLETTLSGSDAEISAENIADYQDAIDSDIDNTLKLEIGNYVFKHENGRIEIHSNNSRGWKHCGTDVLAVII